MGKQYIGYRIALQRTLKNIQPLAKIELALADCDGYILAEDLVARVDSPSADSSMKDGYAVRFKDVEFTSRNYSKPIYVSGTIAAGQKEASLLSPGTAIRILTGAILPKNADTVVAEEFVRIIDDSILVTKPTDKAYNILAMGSDVKSGEILLHAGNRITPGRAGLLAAGGIETVHVFQKPQIGIIATGNEVLLPGQKLTTGKLYASNLLTLNGWCCHFGFKTALGVIGDDADLIREGLQQAVRKQDVIITSGGAWSGDKDLMARVLDDLGWQKIYHRVRLGPGKAVGFGLLHGKPVFILPGGPPSNLIAFLEMALPGLFKLCGKDKHGLGETPAILNETVTGQEDWTQAIFGTLVMTDSEMRFRPHPKTGSRLKSMANANGVLLIPEGISAFQKNDTVKVQVLK
jgi:molybdopterin molybdotransferase